MTTAALDVGEQVTFTGLGNPPEGLPPVPGWEEKTAIGCQGFYLMRDRDGRLVVLSIDETAYVAVAPEGVSVTFHNPASGHRVGFVAGECGHAVALTEWRAGFRKCERC